MCAWISIRRHYAQDGHHRSKQPVWKRVKKWMHLSLHQQSRIRAVSDGIQVLAEEGARPQEDPAKDHLWLG